MTTTGAPAALLARRTGRSMPVTLMLLCVGLLTTLQAIALGERNPINDTLSSYVHVTGGWLFGAALVVLSAGLFEVSRQLRSRGSAAVVMRGMLCGAALSGLVAAFFPADPSDAPAPTVIGEIHKWSSIGLLALAAAAALVSAAAGLLDRRAARAVSVLLAAAALSGAAFLGGQVVKWSAGGPAALADQAPWAGGLTQRILVLCLVCALIVVSDSLLTTGRPDSAELPAAAPRPTLDGQPVISRS